MKQTVKNYTQSDLFKLANQIRKEKGVSQKEAYHMAKSQLETPKSVKKEKKTTGRHNSSNGVMITNKAKEKFLTKYNLKVGTTYPSVKALAEFMGVSVQNLYGYIKIGVLEKI